ncbi:MAG: alpha/beta hydrolase [Terracidiphilus sp.]
MANHPDPVNESAAPRAGIQHHGRKRKLTACVGDPLPASEGNEVNKIKRRPLGLIVVLLAALAQLGVGHAQETLTNWAAGASDHYLVYPDQSYGYFSGVSVKLDVWQAQTKDPVPTVIYYHGGGWFFGDRTGSLPYLMPWLARGWNVINVDYRMSGTALAPAAVEDARCALRWVYRNAQHFHLDTNRIIVTGHSAGGHLALMAGMLREPDGLDNNCPADAAMGDRPLKVAAVVDWYGPTDISDLIAGPNRKTYAVAWLGSLLDRDAEARRVSPLAYARAGLPPILIIHGDSDPVVPYSQSQRLHGELDRAHVPNELYTVAHGSHGMFGAEADVEAYRHVWEFLERFVPAIHTQSP